MPAWSKSGLEKTEQETARELLPIRPRDSHKGTYGSAAIVAGSREYTGAAYLSTAACFVTGRTANGMITWKTADGKYVRYTLKAE